MHEREKRIDARLILSIIATGMMSFAGVVVETAMNITFPTLMREFQIGTSTGAMDYNRVFAGFSYYYSGFLLSETEIYHQGAICNCNDTFYAWYNFIGYNAGFSLLLLAG